MTCQENTPDFIEVTSDQANHQGHDHNYCDSSQQEKDTKDQSTEDRKPDNSLIHHMHVIFILNA